MMGSGRVRNASPRGLRAGARSAFVLVFGLWLLAAACAPMRAGSARDTGYVVFDGQEIGRTRASVDAGRWPKAVSALKEDCAAALAEPPLSVVYPGKKGLSPDPHDYESLATYYWPNPDTPDGLPFVRRDGETYPPSTTPDRAALEDVCKRASLLALGYKMTGDDALAAHAALLIRTFFIAPATRMNPNLNHAQARMGTNTGSAFGIIDTHMLVMLADVPALLSGSSAFTDADRRGFRAWMSHYLDWLLTSPLGREEALAANNHGTWYDAQVVALALASGRTKDARDRIAQARVRLAGQFEPSGMQPEEARRTKSLNYHLFNLEAWFTLALMAEKVGEDLWRLDGESGRTLRQGLDYLAPYLLREKKWPYTQISELSPRNMRQAAFLLRLASRKWREPAYEQSLKKILGKKAASLRINLIYPPAGSGEE